MIRFSCVCGEPFEFPADCAGDEMQCPACKRLVTVPRLSDLDAFAEDGTVKMTDAAPTPSDLAEKLHAFGYRDDMRRSVDEFLLAGEGEAPDAPPARLPPRYDPETGELVTEIPVKEDVRHDRPQDIPMATPTLSYTSAQTQVLDKSVRWYELPWRLLTGHSLVAMSFVFLAHVLIHVAMLMPVVNILFIPLAFGIFLAIVAHYCNVIEEFGPRESDRIPVILRSVSFSEDVLHPLYSLGIAVLFSYGPAIVLKLFGIDSGSPHAWIFWMAMAYGTLVLLAATFTSVCSGALQNMLPQHALSVILVAPGRYLLALVMFLVAIAAYAVAIRGVFFTGIAALQTAAQIPFSRIAVTAGITYAFCLLAIYCMHLSMAWLGFIYRTHYPRLNWILQRFERAERTDTNARLEQMRRSGNPRLHPAVRAKRLGAGASPEVTPLPAPDATTHPTPPLP